MPDVPTMQEQGFKDFNSVNWFGAWLPAGTPPEIVTKLHTELVRLLREPEVQKEFETLGLRGGGSSPADFASFVARETAAAQEIARRIEGRKK
jgi:tripartite-type tricarboxylate transporter receptor subunit TctC